MIRPRTDFRTHVAKADLSVRQLCLAAHVSYSTVTGALTLGQPQRIGGMRERNAWKLARAFAEKTGKTEDEAFDLLFERVEHTDTQGRRITQTPA